MPDEADLTDTPMSEFNPTPDLRPVDHALSTSPLTGVISFFFMIKIEFDIDVQGEGEFDEGIESATFDALASQPAEGDPCEITRDEGIILTQAGSMMFRPQDASRNLHLPGRAGPAFPPRALTGRPDAPGRASHRWTIPADPLARALAITAPFIDAKNSNESRSVATWTAEGVLEGGSPKVMAVVKGLDRPPVPLSFTQQKAELVARFLGRLTGDVEVEVTDSLMIFSCPTAGHRFLVGRELVVFDNPIARLHGKEHEIIRVDLKTILNAIDLLGAILPTDDNRLDLRVRGRAEIASIRISTPGDESRNSRDEFTIIRSFSDPSRAAGGSSRPGDPCGHAEVSPVPSEAPIADTTFAFDRHLMRQSLNWLKCVSLTGRYYRRQSLLHLEAQVTEQRQVVRSVYLAVQDLSADGSGQTTSPPAADPPIGE